MSPLNDPPGSDSRPELRRLIESLAARLEPLLPPGLRSDIAHRAATTSVETLLDQGWRPTPPDGLDPHLTGDERALTVTHLAEHALSSGEPLRAFDLLHGVGAEDPRLRRLEVLH